MKHAIPKWKRFAQEYIIDLNATKAALRSGYSKKSAHVTGARLLKDAKVKAEIERLMAARAKRVEISQDRVLQEIAKIAFADIKDFVKFKTEKVQTGIDAEGRPIYETRHVVVMKPSSKVDGTLINEVSISPRGVLTFKLHDKGRHLELLARHLGILKEPTVKVNVNLDLADRLKKARKRVVMGRGKADAKRPTDSNSGRDSAD